jgi:multiple sugar transport system permease protein
VVTLYIPLGIFVFVLLFPFYWMAITAFKPDAELLSRTGNPFWVIKPTLAHINKLLFQTDYPEWLWNTVIVSVVATFVSLFAGAGRLCDRAPALPGSQARGPVDLPGLSGAAVDPVHPAGAIVFKLGLFDTRWALILTYPTFLIPFCTWLLMGYFRSIPYELEECALIDGATRCRSW